MSACAPFNHKTDERLEGVWVSDREKTLRNLGSSLSEERLRSLRHNLGQLGYCFRGDRAAAFFPGTKKSEVELTTYWVTETTPTSVTVKTASGLSRTLHLQGGCFHHAVPGWGYEEYFCRRPDTENPCG